jgi:hypothetical protein
MVACAAAPAAAAIFTSRFFFVLFGVLSRLNFLFSPFGK